MIQQLLTLSTEGQFLWVWIISGSIFLISFLIQMVFFLSFYSKLISFKKLNEKNQEDPVSVIICAKNEAENLRRYLPSILNQVYPEFEVIVVNDGSTDDTEDVLSEFKSSYKRLYVTGIEGKPGYISGKRVAQALGIKAAHYDQLIFINPDSEPLSPYWIKHMQSNFLRMTDIVLGYGGYKSRKGMLNKLIRTDSVYSYMQSMSFALREIPYTGISRNLGYRKSRFFESKGFGMGLQMKSLDEDYFAIKKSNRYNTAVELHSESHILSEPLKSWKKWLREKRMQHSTTKEYQKKPRRYLKTEAFSRFLFFLSAALLLALWKLPAFIIILLLIREISFSVIFKKVMMRFNEKNIFILSIIYDILWPAFAFLISIPNRFSTKKPKW